MVVEQNVLVYIENLDDLPYGKPTFINYENNDDTDITGLFGFVRCDIECPKDLHIPLLGGKENNKFVFSLEDKINVTYTTQELHKAIEIGYKITNIYDIYTFKKTKKLFKSYIQKFMKEKIYNGGFNPNEVGMTKKEFCKSYKDKFNIELEEKKILVKPNKGKKLLSKLFLNSLWGRYCMRQLPSSQYCTPKEWFALQKRERKKEIEIKSRIDLGDTLYVEFMELKELKTSLKNTNIAVGSMVTSNSRLRLYESL